MSTTDKPVTYKAQSTKPLVWYRLLIGSHVDDSPTEFDPATGKPLSVTYKKGDVFQSRGDLLQENRVRHAPKFELAEEPKPKKAQTTSEVAESTPTSEVSSESPDQMSETLHAMSVSELRAYAQQEEIDIRGARSKEEIIKAIIDSSKE